MTRKPTLDSNPSPVQPASGLAGSPDSANERHVERQFLIFLIGHVLVWTLFATLARSSGALHHDMTEAWSWGKEFQLSYFKHPPFFAWVAGLWFYVMPRQDWSFYLLSSVNAGVGLIGVWFLAGRFLPRLAQLAAVLLLAIGPFYNFLAINYNANSILLAVWPWTAYWFVRSMETRRFAHGAMFGVVSAIAILSKYYSLLLLASCFGASLLHADVRRYYKSAAPYTAVAVCAVLTAPHVWWAVAHDWQTVTYAMGRLDYSPALSSKQAVWAALSYPVFWGLPLLAFLTAFRFEAAKALWQAHAGLTRPSHAWIGVLAFGPYLSTVLIGLIGNARISSNFMIPAYYMVPIALLAAAGAEITAARLAVFKRFAVGLMTVALLASPLASYIGFSNQADMTREPRRELAREATRLWRAAFQTPLRITAGTLPYGSSIPFYSPDAPSEFIELRYDLSPWITPSRIAEEGLLIACVVEDTGCIGAAREITIPGTLHSKLALTRTFLWLRGPTMNFEVFITPPGSNLPPVHPFR